MPFPVLNSNAVIQCMHGGKVTVIPKQMTVLAGGAPVLRVTDLVGAPIVGCPVPPSPGSKPCLVVVAPPMTWAAPKVMTGGLPTLVQSPGPSGLTDGVPPGMIICTSAGQTSVLA